MPACLILPPAAERPPFPARPAAENPAPTPPPRRRTRPAEASHDFLVPNPRPDLTRDALLARMLER